MTAGPEQFSYHVTKDGTVRIAFHGRQVTTVAGRNARLLASRLEGSDAEGVQLLLAKATGNFKR